jgi:hypothetical protein
MAVISGGVLYGLTSLARKYLLPHLRPPSSTAFQQTSSDLTAQYDEAARLLSELQTQTEALQAGLEGERERVRVAVEDVEEAVRGVREGEERWREEMREIRGEVESVRELVPRVSPSGASDLGRSSSRQVSQSAGQPVGRSASRQVSQSGGLCLFGWTFSSQRHGLLPVILPTPGLAFCVSNIHPAFARPGLTLNHPANPRS